MVVIVSIACTELKNEFANSENVLCKRCFVMFQKVGKKVNFLPPRFIAREGMSVRPSVRLSVCLSHSGIKTKKASVMISSPSESTNILVSGNIRFIPKFDRVTPSEGETGVGTNWRFWRFFDQ